MGAKGTLNFTPAQQPANEEYDHQQSDAHAMPTPTPTPTRAMLNKRLSQGHVIAPLAKESPSLAWNAVAGSSPEAT